MTRLQLLGNPRILVRVGRPPRPPRDRLTHRAVGEDGLPYLKMFNIKLQSWLIITEFESSLFRGSTAVMRSIYENLASTMKKCYILLILAALPRKRPDPPFQSIVHNFESTML